MIFATQILFRVNLSTWTLYILLTISYYLQIGHNLLLEYQPSFPNSFIFSDNLSTQTVWHYQTLSPVKSVWTWQSSWIGASGQTALWTMPKVISSSIISCGQLVFIWFKTADLNSKYLVNFIISMSGPPSWIWTSQKRLNRLYASEQPTLIGTVPKTNQLIHI